MAAALPVFEKFIIHEESTSVGQRWKKWLQRFEVYLDAYDIKVDKRRRALLLHSAGYEVQDVFETLENRGEDYDAAKAALNAYFLPKVNKAYEVYIFRNAKQKQGESLDAYNTRLRQLAETCSFTNTDEEIKSHIILSCSSTRLRRRALREDLLLKDLLDYGRALEVSEKQARGIEDREESSSSHETVKKIQSKPETADSTRRGPKKTTKPQRRHEKVDKTCYRCGGSFPHPDSCPAKDKTCRKCQKVGHYARVCKSKESKKVNVVEPTRHESTDEEYVYNFSVLPIATNKPNTEVMIGETSVKCLIDSGAGVNIIDLKTFNTMRSVKLLPITKKIFAYKSRQPIPVKGEFKSVVQSSLTGQSKEAHFCVVEGSDGNLLGFETATDLGLLHIVNSVSSSTVDNIVSEFSDRFEGIGKMNNTTVKLHIDTTVKPVAQQHRRVPFHIREKVESELKRLQELDIIEKADGATPWVSPIVIVPKKEGIRICVDMRAANTAIERERHPMPTIEDLIVDLNGATVFSKLDLNQGYHQLELDPESRYITTFATHMGLYRYKRLSFGVNSASEIFQKAVSSTLQGILGARNISDDIIVFGNTQAEHDMNLKAVFQRLRDYNLTLNLDKCEFSKPDINFYGHHFSKDGIDADDKKVSSLLNASAPSNASEARSFLGMAQYLSRYIQDFATITAPIRRLTHHDAPWVWGQQQQEAFECLKTRMASHKVMKYFNQSLETEVIVDASPCGLGAILSQISPNGQSDVVAYASRSLTDPENRYSQTEREALGVIWGIEHFHLYLYGSAFTVVTDHKPLESIFNNPNCKPTTRLERLCLRLQPYKVKVVYRPGKDNPADYMSRHPDPNHSNPSHHTSRIDAYVKFVTTNAVPSAMTLQEIQDATSVDVTLKKLSEVIMNQKWYNIDEDIAKFKSVKNELSISKGVLLRGNRLIVPQKLQEKAVKLAHSGHQGIVKTKQLLRETVWFPGIDKMVEDMVSRCLACQAANHSPKPALEPLQMSQLPTGPWKELSVDFCGPFPSGDYLLVVVDDYSRFPEVEFVKSTAATTVIPRLDVIFARQGIPEKIRSDNGPPFNSESFKAFAEHLGFEHRRVTPLWPRANGEVERLMRTLEKAVRTASLEHKNWKQELISFLRQYRATPHSTTGESPAELLNGRKLKTTLPEIPKNELKYSDARKRDADKKQIMKKYADKRNHAKESDLQIGDKVLIKQEKENKMSTPFKPVPYEVKDRKGSMITARRGDHHVTRNMSFFKRLPSSVSIHPTNEEEEIEFEIENPDIQLTDRQGEEREVTNTSQLLRRSTREKTSPNYLQDYVT